jgi:DnaK suppressor protein
MRVAGASCGTSLARLGGMDTQQLDRFRRRLEADRADANRRITVSQASAQEAINPDEAEVETQAAESLAADLELTIAEHQTHRYDAIDAALGRIADGEYGECEDCGDDIPVARLEVEPTATRCTSCQATHETRANPTL